MTIPKVRVEQVNFSDGDHEEEIQKSSSIGFSYFSKCDELDFDLCE